MANSDRTLRTITTLYTDLRAFSDRYTDLTLAQLADLIDTHYADAAAIVADCGGAVDKFMGDSILAHFNAVGELPDAATRAVVAARRLKARVAERWPSLPLSAGVATGEAIVGHFGPPSQRFHTAFGDVVTRAARLERRSHATGFPILIDQATRAALAADIAVREHPTAGTALEALQVFEVDGNG